jgi:hypothetical protein
MFFPGSHIKGIDDDVGTYKILASCMKFISAVFYLAVGSHIQSCFKQSKLPSMGLVIFVFPFDLLFHLNIFIATCLRLLKTGKGDTGNLIIIHTWTLIIVDD